MKKPFYITTTLPYVNSDPHVGFALEIIRADAIARYKKLTGHEVFFNTGTDEHGIKIFNKAKDTGVDVQKYVDEYANKFKDLLNLLGILPEINFIRTTDENHIKSAQEFWRICDKNGYIYKKNYKTKYCVGCELEKTDSELVDGKCPLHPKNTIEVIEEENYFFKFSAFGTKLLDLYNSRPDLVIPSFRLNEIKAFVSRGLEDFSISRLKSKMPWGIDVPNDSEHVMYVWFDALVNYISAIGWPNDLEKFNKWGKESGGMVQYCGKDNLRQQSAMWQAMLFAVDLPNSKNIIINGFITGEGGVKMSKSLNNVINPNEVVKEFGKEALRFFLCHELSPFEDSPFTMDRIKNSYNSFLANGIGNLISRITKMASGVNLKIDNIEDVQKDLESSEEWKEYSKAFDEFNIQNASQIVWKMIKNTDEYIQKTEPFKVVKVDLEEGKKHILKLLTDLAKISILLKPIMPDTAEIALRCIRDGVVPEKPVFMRIK